MKADSGTIFSKSVLTDWPVDAAPWPVVAIAFMLALRAVSAATAYHWVYRDRVFKVDEELKGLGIDSNRKIESLQRLIEMLDDTQRAATVRTVLSRYTDRSFETAQQGRQWLAENKDRIYFTDVGGYKFKIVPPGYPIAK